VFTHGAFVTSRCWDNWLKYFQRPGYKCIAPPWPRKLDTAQALRSRHPDPNIASLGFAEIIEQYASIVRRLDQKPILIGHSIGGLLVQLLLQQGLGEAEVAIHSAPPQGVISTKFSFLKSGWKTLLPTSRSYLMSSGDWQYAFTNGLSPEFQKSSYDQFLVPESRRVMRGLLTSLTRIDFSKSHPPLLFTAGSGDHFIPSSLNRTNYAKYKDPNSTTDFKEFHGRTHFVLGQEGWEEVAEYILQWLRTH
jgi:pimeloyl-ACP methyl ester carboxylesterase